MKWASYLYDTYNCVESSIIPNTIDFCQKKILPSGKKSKNGYNMQLYDGKEIDTYYSDPWKWTIKWSRCMILVLYDTHVTFYEQVRVPYEVHMTCEYFCMLRYANTFGASL